MASEKQLTANRRNALRSTGPRSAGGKAKAARNALKHGLSSRDMLLADEDEETFAHMQREVHFELRPEGEVETFLARRVAAGIWRLNRLLRVEAEMFDKPEIAAYDAGKGPGWIFRSTARRGANAFATLMRYESGITRGVFRALHEQERLRTLREGVATPPDLPFNLTFSSEEQD